jgi:heat shock protein HslJ
MMKLINYSILVCLLALAACSKTKKSAVHTENKNEDVSQEITDKKWKLIELAGKPVADSVNGKLPFLLLQKADRRYSASGGCNGLGGEFELLPNGKIKFTQGMSTMMACEDMWVETELNQALVEADNYTLGDNTLSLNKARMAPLARFQAVEGSGKKH